MKSKLLVISIIFFGCKNNCPDLGDYISKTKTGFVLTSSDSIINFQTLKRHIAFRIFLNLYDCEIIVGRSKTSKVIKAKIIQYDDSPNKNCYDTVECGFTQIIDTCSEQSGDILTIDFAQLSKEKTILNILGAHIYICYSKRRNKITGFFLGHPSNRLNGEILIFHATDKLIHCDNYTTYKKSCMVLE